jgi:hypothetical protein
MSAAIELDIDTRAPSSRRARLSRGGVRGRAGRLTAPRPSPSGRSGLGAAAREQLKADLLELPRTPPGAMGDTRYDTPNLRRHSS